MEVDIYYSGLTRTTQTAQAIYNFFRKDRKVKACSQGKDLLLREIEMGKWTRLPTEERKQQDPELFLKFERDRKDDLGWFETRYPDKKNKTGDAVILPRGESVKDVYRRSKMFVKFLRESYAKDRQGKPIIIVTHGRNIPCLVAALAGVDELKAIKYIRHNPIINHGGVLHINAGWDKMEWTKLKDLRPLSVSPQRQ